MPQRFILENPVYHTISVTHRRTPFFSDSKAASTLIEAIRREREVGHAYVLAYAILPDHMHLLFVPREPAMDVSKLMHNLKSFSAKEINRMLGRSGRFGNQASMTA